jgi:hypothetical protein
VTNTYSEPELANGATTRWIVGSTICGAPHRCTARCNETGYEVLCGEQERKALHLVSRDQSDRFALLNVPLITCEAVEGIQIGQRAIA